MKKQEFRKTLTDLLWKYYAYKGYSKKLDLGDFLDWLRSHDDE